ncbi:MAG: PD40 domain-containing protein [Armatimonadetes bacterium]|nr:PD40 domain-containing protein [Armatimonadota bacterium]
MIQYRRHGRGLTLFEVMVVMGIMIVISGYFLLNSRNARGRANARAVATLVEAELKLARQRAISEQRPVTVSIPSPVADSVYCLAGESEPQVTRVVRFGTEYPGTTLCVAQYPTGAAVRRNMPVPGSKADAWGDRLDQWIPAGLREDYHLIFTPNGSVISNDLPTFDGAYAIVVSAGIETAGGPAPGTGPDYVTVNPPYLALGTAGEAYTLLVDSGGGVHKRSGLAGYSGAGVNLVNAIPVTAGDTAAPPAPTEVVSERPEILVARIHPDPDPSLPPNTYVLSYGEYLTMEVFARSIDGTQLYTGWEDDPITQGDPDYKGRFSCPRPDATDLGRSARDRMEYFPAYDIDKDGSIGSDEKQVWRSVWAWTPPPNAAPGDTYSLGLDVTEATGTLKVSLPGPPPTVIVSPPGEIVFESGRDGVRHLYTMWADGTHQDPLTNTGLNDTCPSASADGTKIAFQRGDDLWVMNSDGTMPNRVVNDGRFPVISPAGDWLAFKRGVNEIWIAKTDGSGAQTFITGATVNMERMGWSRDGRRLFYEMGTDIHAVDLDFGPPGPLVSVTPSPFTISEGGETVKSPSVSLATGEIFYTVGNTVDPVIARYPGGRFSPSGGLNEAFPTISPKGDRLLIVEGLIGNQQIVSIDPSAFPARLGRTVLTALGQDNTRPAWIRQRLPIP